ncbi:MAG TPA: Uma2 family endonuclease [Acetobacteraceae bacterium]|jgi:Uma2 family endonuclease|nr:Uma2 family endonuclease [Acetobacteraceae bacterium]
MTVAQRIPEQEWTAELFLTTDQHMFGDAWRYELVDGRIVAHAAPSPEHGAILAGLTGALTSRLRGNPNGCRPESGSGAVPRSAQRATARIPDALIRCGEHPKVMFEVISPSELRNWTERDAKRRDLQAVEGAQEIVELYQAEQACHIYRRQPEGTWSFEAQGGADAILQLPSVCLAIPLSEIYAFAELPEPGSDDSAAKALG